MKTRYASLLAATIALLLATASTRAETVLANGLRNTGLGSVGLQVTEPQWVLPYGYWSPANHAIIEISGLTSLGLKGVEVQLGHSRGGAYFHPWAEAQPGYFMSALSFGRVDGESGRYLASIAGRREQDWGEFTAWADFSPLCLGPYRYRFYSYGGLQNEIVSWEREMHFIGAYYAPRVNPCAIDADGQIKAVIDFQNSYADVRIGDVTAGVTRLEILPTVRHRPIDFATSVQIRGGGGLNSFGLYQVEPFAFGFPHKVIGGGTARLEVEPSRARLERASESANVFLGTWVETPAASRMDLQFEPLFASTNDVQIRLQSIGFGTFGQGSYVGEALLTLRTNGASLWSRLDICTNQQVAVFRDGVELGQTPYSTNAASLEVEEPVGLRAASVLAHTTNTLAALQFVFDRAAPVIFPDGRRFEADEVRVRAGAAATLEHVTRAGLTASNLTVVTITNELSSPAHTPALSIETVGQQVHLSWPDPNRVYYLQCSTDDPANEWANIPDRPMLMNGIATVILPKSETEHRFYRLYLSVSWDRPMGPGRD